MQIFSCPSVCPIFCLWNNKNDLHIGQLLHDIRGLRTRCKYTKKCELKFQYLVQIILSKYMYWNARSMPIGHPHTFAVTF